MRLSVVLVLLACLGIGPRAFAQNANVIPCYTDQLHEQQLAGNPEAQQRYQATQAAIRRKLQAAGQAWAAKHAGQQPEGGNSQYIIPTVVHVVYGQLNSQNLSAKISRAQVKSQFEAMHQDFRNIPGTIGFSENGVDTKIEFSLATKDPQGDSTDGIVYHNDPYHSINNRGNQDELDMKTKYFWDRESYFNVYLVSEIGGSSGGGNILGYARFPGSNPQTDGVVIRADSWGTMGIAGGPSGGNQYGRTGTHEMGHWLALFHPFQGACSSNCSGTGDQVCDTPPARNPTYGGSPMRENSCGLDLPDRPDRPRNFMDYMNDIASTHFTPGQLQRMEAALTTQSLDQRYPLWQDQNLQETGAGPYKRPTAVMAATNQETHTGGYVHFLNFSRNAPDTFRWEFEGGMPATSSKASPKVRYDSAGSYDVTFIVGNSQGEFDTLTQKNYVSVKDTVYELPLEESFESNFTTLPSDWYLINTDRVGPKNKLGWEPTALAGANGSNRSVAMYCSQYTMIGERDGLVTPPLNFGSLDSAAISFSVAYAPFNNTDLDNPYTYTDSLALYASQDGGASWSKLYQKGGKNLAANGQAINKDQFDNPTADQWLRDTLNLNALTGEGPVLLKFEAINGWGNNIYLDEIKIEELDYQPDTSSADSSEDTTSRMHASAPATRIQLYPNPVRSATQLKLQMAERQAVSYQVLDINGRVVASQSLGPVGRGTSEHRISTAALSPGVYTIRIQAGREPHVRQLVKY